MENSDGVHVIASGYAGADHWHVQLFRLAALDIIGRMWGSASQIHIVRQRLALLKQQELELRNSFSQSHATLNDTRESETKLVALAAEIAEMESDISSQ